LTPPLKAAVWTLLSKLGFQTSLLTIGKYE
jgi:hypothetical protein